MRELKASMRKSVNTSSVRGGRGRGKVPPPSIKSFPYKPKVISTKGND